MLRSVTGGSDPLTERPCRGRCRRRTGPGVRFRPGIGPGAHARGGFVTRGASLGTRLRVGNHDPGLGGYPDEPAVSGVPATPTVSATWPTGTTQSPTRRPMVSLPTSKGPLSPRPTNGPASPEGLLPARAIAGKIPFFVPDDLYRGHRHVPHGVDHRLRDPATLLSAGCAAGSPPTRDGVHVQGPGTVRLSLDCLDVDPGQAQQFRH